MLQAHHSNGADINWKYESIINPSAVAGPQQMHIAYYLLTGGLKGFCLWVEVANTDHEQLLFNVSHRTSPIHPSNLSSQERATKESLTCTNVSKAQMLEQC